MPNLTVDPQLGPLISNDHITVNLSPHNLPKALILGLTLFVLLSVTAYGAYWYIKSYLVAPSSQPTLSNVPSEVSPTKNSFESLNNRPTPPAIDETANWKTYTNTKYRFSFMYPDAISLKEQDNSQSGQFTVTSQSSELAMVLEINELEPQMSRNYLGTPSSGTTEQGGLSWDILKNSGYCDAGECGNSFIAYQVIKGTRRYTFIFYGETVKSEHYQILSTFKFL